MLAAAMIGVVFSALMREIPEDLSKVDELSDLESHSRRMLNGKAE